MAKQKNKTYISPTELQAKLPKALTKNQTHFIQATLHKSLVIALGSAGTGKSYLSASMAAYFYLTGKIDKIILTRPTVPTGKSIGFFPGSLEEKMEPWVSPFISVLETHLTKGKVELMRKSEQIQIVPFEVIRGRSWNDAFIVLDEAQNATLAELKAFVTRQGDNSTMVINGDTTQTDLKELSGLNYIVDLAKTHPSLQEYVDIINFTSEDIVRSGICKAWVEAFEK